MNYTGRKCQDCVCIKWEYWSSGDMSVTRNSTKCAQRATFTHTYSNAYFPGQSIMAASNFCWNPCNDFSWVRGSDIPKDGYLLEACDVLLCPPTGSVVWDHYYTNCQNILTFVFSNTKLRYNDSVELLRCTANMHCIGTNAVLVQYQSTVLGKFHHTQFMSGRWV